MQQPFVERLNEVFHFADDFTWIRGRHSLKFGGEVQRQHMFIAFVNRPNGDFTFTGDTTQRTGNAAADFLLGLPSQFRRTTANTPQDGHGWIYAGTRRTNSGRWPNVTVNAGLRYEVSVPFVDANDALNSFRPGQQSTRFPQAPLGLVYPGDAGVPRGTYETDKNNFAPRVGVAWDPTGTRPLQPARRLGHLLRRARRTGRLLPERRARAAVHAAARSQRAAGGADAAESARRPSPAARRTSRPGSRSSAGAPISRSRRRMHFNVIWQQELGRNLGAEIGYVGSRGKNLPIFMEVNPGVYTPGQTTSGARLLPGVRARAADVLGGEVLVRLAAGEPADASDARA